MEWYMHHIVHSVTHQPWRHTKLFKHWHNVEMTWQRCINTVSTLKLHHVPAWKVVAIVVLYPLYDICDVCQDLVFSCCSGSPTTHKQLYHWKLLLSTGQLNLYLIMCKIYQMPCDLTKSLTFPSLRKDTLNQ
jgi:hypothetical protein